MEVERLHLGVPGFGEIAVGRKTYGRDIYITADGKVKKRDKALARQFYGGSHAVGPKELEKVCRGDPAVLFIGSGHSGMVELTEESEHYLAERGIECRLLPTPKAAEAYNKSQQRKAALIHVTC